jgi:hypothetical protein
MKQYALILAVLLTGCASVGGGQNVVPTRVDTVEVKVQVMVPIPAPPVTARPALVIFDLKEADKKDPGKVALAYQATIKQLQGYALQLETVVESYRKLSKEKPNEGK